MVGVDCESFSEQKPNEQDLEDTSLRHVHICVVRIDCESFGEQKPNGQDLEDTSSTHLHT